MQPKLRPDDDRVRGILLLAVHTAATAIVNAHGGEAIRPGLLGPFLEHYMLVSESTIDHADRDVTSMLERARGPEGVPLRAVNAWQDVARPV